MQPEYLARLSEPVQHFVREVEDDAGVEIIVIPDIKQNEGGTTGQGNLAADIGAKRIHLFAPTTGYLPDGGVRHEVLHAWRFHVMGVPKLALAEMVNMDMSLSSRLTHIDNAIEHVIIVPIELRLHPERRDHWERVMRDACSDLPNVPERDLRLALCLHWTFLRHVMPDSPSFALTRDFASKHAMLEIADAFADRFISSMGSKAEIVRRLFELFPDLPRNRSALEYINSRTGTRQEAIP